MGFCWSGNTAFGMAVFRYRVSVSDDHLVRIWLEEGVAKKQWRTARLHLMDDVAARDRFHVIGVAQHLINCFNASLDGQSNYFRELRA
ncbi:hypothetical protein Poli38472_013606 [Pythium oligandrum]|uniref:Uncharacterized protein n=1 Tax=Pythium oligandrum TaxID=41045 RepID=A0A8K1CDR9_PYTOL|nr:hypothetical protein Poli38472_013606 [Pythium oligandrum]|eukprot:TMW61143.1 hypothetical protein Poli38472_013606 [Pythium oligandrum]